MFYLNEAGVAAAAPRYAPLVDVIEEATRCLSRGDFAQPLKPYLRYGDPQNRIIAMPAYVGAPFASAGIKWIASFPGNVARGLRRAHSVVVLNDAATGVPTAIVNTPLLSVLRTAAVSGAVLRRFVAARPRAEVTLGITGWGPIGRAHHAMCKELLGARLARTLVYDARPEATVAGRLEEGVAAVASWQEAYGPADVFVAATVAHAPYIDEAPKAGSLQLNVSLRDYTVGVFPFVKHAIIVDDWDEVCRENTDIESFHKRCGLEREGTTPLADFVASHGMGAFPSEATVMFNPMGMALFDVAIASHVVAEAAREGIAQRLDD